MPENTLSQEQAQECAIKRILGQYAEGWAWQIVGQLLESAGGDVRKAMRLMTAEGADSAPFHLGNFGYSGPGEVTVMCMGNAGKRNQIRVWYPETRITDPQDFTFPWSAVFEYVLEHGELECARQLHLF
jgi:hypothetical protein